MSVTNDEPMITEREVAERTRTTVHMWRNRRSAGDGPPYLKVGRAVRYRWSQVEAWITTQSAGSNAA